MSDLNIENKVPAEYQRGIITDIFRDIQNAWNGLKTSFTTIAINIQSINSGQISGFRNSFINGAYQVNQIYNPANAATGSAVTVTAGVTHAAGAVCAIDNWYTECTGQNITAQQIAGTAPFKYAYKLLAGATGATTTLHGTRIEGKDCVKDVNQVKGISLWMTHDVARTVTWTAYYANTEDTFSAKTQIATGTIAATAARAQYFFSFNAGANASNGLCIEYTTGALTNSTGYVIYEGNQNERVSAGATAGTSYEHVDYDIMLPRCMYYLPVFNFEQGSALGAGYFPTTTLFVGQIQFLVKTRAPVTGVVINNQTYLTGTDGQVNFTASAAVLGPFQSAKLCSLALTVAGATARSGGALTFNNAAGQVYFIGAQL